MAFGYIKYSTDENMGIVGFLKRLMGKSKIEKLPGFGDDGLLITLPYGKYEGNIKLREKANKNIFKFTIVYPCTPFVDEFEFDIRDDFIIINLSRNVSFEERDWQFFAYEE